MFVVKKKQSQTRYTDAENIIDGMDEIRGLQNNDYIHYVMWATNGGSQMTESDIKAVFVEYVDILDEAKIYPPNFRCNLAADSHACTNCRDSRSGTEC